jgi:hypothetical protein
MDDHHLSNITKKYKKHLGLESQFQPKIDEGLE